MTALHPGDLVAIARLADALGELLGELVIFDARTDLDDEVHVRGQLRSRQFREDTSPAAPICRWLLDTLKVDVMPTDARVLGFSNRWYVAAVQHAEEITLPDCPTIRCVTAPYFLATKHEAFLGRGRSDFLGSADLEDIVAIIDGRRAVVQEIAAAPEDVRAYLKSSVAALLGQRAFLDALSGHLRSDIASQARLPALLSRLHAISDL